jgi:serine/threonine-protein kinase
MADVYLAQAIGAAGFERVVAVKLITARLAADPELLAQFLDEARLAACIHHPNVVQIYDLDRQGELYFIAMEMVEGADLSRLLKISRRAELPVPLPIAFRIAMQICAGVHAAHSAKASDGHPLELVHRDVKAANILVSRHGDVKVSDFGIARARDCYLLHRTTRGEMKGTPSYMAPEQVLGKALDPRSDEYAVAALAYELFSSRRINLDPERLLMHGRVGWPHLDPLHELRAELPAELDAIVRRGLAFAADDRYPDCAALLDALEAAAQAHGAIASDRAVGAWVEKLLAWEAEHPVQLVSQAS